MRLRSGGRGAHTNVAAANVAARSEPGVWHAHPMDGRQTVGRGREGKRTRAPMGVGVTVVCKTQ